MMRKIASEDGRWLNGVWWIYGKKLLVPYMISFVPRRISLAIEVSNSSDLIFFRYPFVFEIQINRACHAWCIRFFIIVSGVPYVNRLYTNWRHFYSIFVTGSPGSRLSGSGMRFETGIHLMKQFAHNRHLPCRQCTMTCSYISSTQNDINSSLQTPHVVWVPVVRIWAKMDHVITQPHCIRLQCLPDTQKLMCDRSQCSA